MNYIVIFGALYLINGMELTTFLLTGTGMLCLLCYMLCHNQEGLLFHPKIQNFVIPSQNPETFRNPKERNLPYENIYITTSDNIRIHCWFIHRGDPSSTYASPTILFFHANAGSKYACYGLWENVFCV